MKPYIVLLTLACTGCASQDMWYLNGRSEAEFRQADIACWEYAQAAYAEADYSMGGAAYNVGAAGDPGLTGAFLGLLALGETGKDALHEQCMNARGFAKAD